MPIVAPAAIGSLHDAPTPDSGCYSRTRFLAGVPFPMINAFARLLLAAPLALGASPIAAATLPEARRFGIVRLQGDGTGCAVVADPSVPVGERVAVIIADGMRHRLARAVIAGAANAPCPEMPANWRNAGDAVYRLRVMGAGADRFAGGMLIRTPPARLRVGKDGHATGRDQPGVPPLVFSDCTSSEGVHYFVWPGAVGTGRPLWHRYAYLGYDTAVTCTNMKVQ